MKRLARMQSVSETLIIDELNDLGYLVEEDAFKTEKVIAGQW